MVWRVGRVWDHTRNSSSGLAARPRTTWLVSVSSVQCPPAK